MKFLDQLRQWLASSTEPLGRFTRDDGSTVTMDRLTVETMVSTLPDPNQASLDAVTRHADRVRITKGGCGTEPLGTEIVLDVHGDDARAFGDLISIVEDAESFHCMCLGSYAIELFRSEERLAVIGLHHAYSIRWQGVWHWDARLRDPDALVEWMAAHGASGPKEERERAAAAHRASEEEAQRWLSLAPECVRSRTDLIFDDFPDREKGRLLLQALSSGVPDAAEQVRILFRWDAAARREGGMPSYQGLPYHALLACSAEALFAGASGELDDPSLSAACRFFVDDDFAARRYLDAIRMPAALKERLRPHAGGSRQAELVLTDGLALLMQRCPQWLELYLPRLLERIDTLDNAHLQSIAARASSHGELARDLLAWLADAGFLLSLHRLLCRLLNQVSLADILQVVEADASLTKGMFWYALGAFGPRHAEMKTLPGDLPQRLMHEATRVLHPQRLEFFRTTLGL